MIFIGEVINISIIVENEKIKISDFFDLGLHFNKEYPLKKEYPIKPTGDNPIHKNNIEEIRIIYNNVRDLFKISITPTTKFRIFLNAKICKCEHLDLFLDIYCINKEDYREKIKKN